MHRDLERSPEIPRTDIGLGEGCLKVLLVLFYLLCKTLPDKCSARNWIRGKFILRKVLQ